MPCPEVWRVLETGEGELSEADQIKLEELADGRVLVDATEQRVSRATDNETRKKYYSGKKKQFTLKTQLVTDSDHHILAVSEAVPGAEHDKTLSDQLDTLEHLPDGVTHSKSSPCNLCLRPQEFYLALQAARE